MANDRAGRRTVGAAFLDAAVWPNGSAFLFAGAVVGRVAGLAVRGGVCAAAAVQQQRRALDAHTHIRRRQIGRVKMVLNGATATGHTANSTYWGAAGLGNSDGYISLPLTFVTLFCLPFPLFYGVLVTKKDVIDYFLPGIYGFGFDFGYIALIFIIAWILLVIIVGLKILYKYREKREQGDNRYIGREALLIGSLSGFIAQTILGFFIINRTINGSALVTFIIISALIMSNVVSTKR